MLLKLSHYNHWLHFGGSGGDYPMHWLQASGPAPMRETKIILGITLVILIGVNIWGFLRKEPSTDQTSD